MGEITVFFTKRGTREIAVLLTVVLEFSCECGYMRAGDSPVGETGEKCGEAVEAGIFGIWVYMASFMDLLEGIIVKAWKTTALSFLFWP